VRREREEVLLKSFGEAANAYDSPEEVKKANLVFPGPMIYNRKFRLP
jgi:hypothetical protein